MGEKQIGQGGFVDAFMAPGVGANRRLERIDALLKWYRFEKLLKPLRSDVGRPGYPALSMFKALLLQQWYGLSDPGLEEALLDRLSFRRFCGFSLDDATPDETTFVRFRTALGEAGIAEKLFAEVNRQLDKNGVILKTGTLVDASLVAMAVKRPPPGEGVQSDKDPDAGFTKRQGQEDFFGYKAHIGVDLGSDLVRTAVLTSANINESTVADALICGDEKAVYADKAYESKERRRRLKEAGIKDRIMHRRHKHQKDGLPRLQKMRNRLITPIRANVERLFGLMKRSYGYRQVRYRGLVRNQAQLHLMCIAINLRRAETLLTP